MKISLVTETYPPEVNGVAMTLSRLVHGLVNRGHTLQVIRPRQHNHDAGAEAERMMELTVPGAAIPRYEGLRFGFPAKNRLMRLWKNDRPEIIHVATEGPLGWSAIRAAAALGIPVVSSFHTNFHVYGKHYGYGGLIRMALTWLRYVHNKTRRTFVPSEDVRQMLEKSGFQNTAILGRGVDTGLFSPERRSSQLREQWGVDENTPVVIYVGRIASEKNIPLCVEAFNAMKQVRPDLKFVLVGDGPERKRLEQQHPDFYFCGLRRGEDLAAHYASADLFLFGSVTETFGNVVTEAMASGIPALAFNYAAPQQYITSGQNGITVPFGDERAFVDAAADLAGNVPAWKTMGEAARKTALTISWDAVIDGYDSELQTVLKEAQKTR